MSKVYIPQDYHTPLSVYEMQRAIEFIKSNFQVNLSNALNLRRVSAPLFVDENSGLNDNLNGVERPVSFDIPDVGTNAQVVHSLAKWKRLALKRYDFKLGKGLLHRHERHPPRRRGRQPPLRLCGPVGLGKGHLRRGPQRRLSQAHRARYRLPQSARRAAR